VWCGESPGKKAKCEMLLGSDDTKNGKWPLDLAARSLDGIGGSSSIGQVRSEAPDVRRWRNNLEEGNGGSGGKDTILNKFGRICKERKMEGAEYIELRKLFFFL